MKNTSIGFHTFTMSYSLTWKEAYALKKEFEIYRNKTEKIEIEESDKIKNIITEDGTTLEIPLCTKIQYKGKYKGISWKIRFSEKHYYFFLEATINPKILAGITDYVAASNETHIKPAAQAYNTLAQRISDKIPLFTQYRLNRVDYCINFDLKELGYKCNPAQLMKLIKSGEIPYHYEERESYYCKKSHRWTNNTKHSHYLKSDSVVINCYWKHWQLKEKYPNNPDLDRAENVIRLEIQYKNRKLSDLRNKLTQRFMIELSECEEDEQEFFLTLKLLSDEVSREVVNKYFKRIIGNEDYFTMEAAIELIDAQPYRNPRRSRLIKALELVAEHGSVSAVKKHFKDDDKLSYDFNLSLRQLALIGVNPVTLPPGLKVKALPGLMRAYNRWEFEIKQEDVLKNGMRPLIE